MVLAGTVEPGDTVTVDERDANLQLEVSKGASLADDTRVQAGAAATT